MTTDTTHWAPSDAMAALERGHDPREVFAVAYARALGCGATFDYVRQARWQDVCSKSHRIMHPERCAVRDLCVPTKVDGSQVEQVDGNPWIQANDVAIDMDGACRYNAEERREIFGTWASGSTTIDILDGSILDEALKPGRPVGLNSGATFVLSGRRAGKMAAAQAWAEENGARLVGLRMTRPGRTARDITLAERRDALRRFGPEIGPIDNDTTTGQSVVDRS